MQHDSYAERCFFDTGILWIALLIGRLFRTSILCGHSDHGRTSTQVLFKLLDGLVNVYEFVWDIKRADGALKKYATARSYALYNNLRWFFIFHSVLYLLLWRYFGLFDGHVVLGNSVSCFTLVPYKFSAWWRCWSQIRIRRHGTSFKACFHGMCSVSGNVYGKVSKLDYSE